MGVTREACFLNWRRLQQSENVTGVRRETKGARQEMQQFSNLHWAIYIGRMGTPYLNCNWRSLQGMLFKKQSLALQTGQLHRPYRNYRMYTCHLRKDPLGSATPSANLR